MRRYTHCLLVGNFWGKWSVPQLWLHPTPHCVKTHWPVSAWCTCRLTHTYPWLRDYNIVIHICLRLCIRRLHRHIYCPGYENTGLPVIVYTYLWVRDVRAGIRTLIPDYETTHLLVIVYAYTGTYITLVVRIHLWPCTLTCECVMYTHT